MGQYYAPLMIREGKKTAFSVQIKGWNRHKNKFDYYNGVKLMEHSWIGNSFTDAFSWEIYKKPAKVAWVGDYSYDRNNDCGDGSASEKMTKEMYESAYGKTATRVDIPKAEKFDHKGKWLINHTYKVGFRFDDLACQDGWTVYPVSLLTACGNGLGGGDYYESHPDYSSVGSWAFDEISIEDELPEGYTKDEAPTFLD